MIMRGYKVLPKYGKHCPICLDQLGVPVDCTENEESAPVMWHQTIAYCCGEEHRDAFHDDAFHYASLEPPLPSISSTVIVLGPPLSFRSALSSELADALGLVLLTSEAVIGRAINEHAATSVGRQIKKLLLAGQPVDDVTFVRALQQVVRSDDCYRHGWVLEGFPRTEADARLLRQHGIVPHKVLSLRLDDAANSMEELRQRRRKHVLGERESFLNKFEPMAGGVRPPLPSLTMPPLLAADLQEYRRELDALHNYFQRRFENLHILDGNKSKWHVKDVAVRIIQESRASRQTYAAALAQERPAPIANLCLNKRFIRKHRSAFQDYCPVCWLNDQALRFRSSTLEFSVEYKHHYFHLCGSAHLSAFVARPEVFAPEEASAAPLPAHLPRRVAFADCQLVQDVNCQLRGNCPVTLVRSLAKGRASVVAGSPYIVVEYKGKLFRCVTELDCQEFLSFPERYCHVRLPRNLPPSISSQSPLDLLAAGKTMAFMEAVMGTPLIKALATFDRHRPKYPGLGVKPSALAYLALTLKASNTQSQPFLREGFATKLESFLHDCELVPGLSDAYREAASAAADKDDLERRLNPIIQCRRFKSADEWLQHVSQLWELSFRE